ncbi:hypothetical protein [Prevotella dentasini]|uniref:hypothetical protein n=1 Tax=Prevotella dentasini TaxID=589537 RepID=UPI000468F550|nr:hypothetical protein [Prevotella dentasini]
MKDIQKVSAYQMSITPQETEIWMKRQRLAVALDKRCKPLLLCPEGLFESTGPFPEGDSAPFLSHRQFADSSVAHPYKVQALLPCVLLPAVNGIYGNGLPS